MTSLSRPTTIGPWRTRRATGAAAVATAAIAIAVPAIGAAPAIAAGAHAAAAPAAGARVVSSKRIDRRLRELTLRTPALARRTRVRVLLPAGYARHRGRRYPVLYLLHGAGGDARDWTAAGDAERITAGRPLIVVMPDGGHGGWYSDWYNGGRGGQPRWERYHIDQLIPLVDHRYRTIGARRGRAIAGLSMGGFGALSYAARHPDLFTAAASFSGGIDLTATDVLPGQTTPPGVAGEVVVNATLEQDGDAPNSVFGPFATQEIRWRGHNPLDLAANMRAMAIRIDTGNGEPGGPFGPDHFDLIEFGAHAMSVNVHRRLRRLGIEHVFDDYGAGGHTWPYWQRDLRRTLPGLMRRFAHPATPPARVSYRSIERAYDVYGWRVRLRRPNVEFSALRNAGSHGFALRGSGRATVTTPGRYRPRARFRVRVKRGGETTTRRLRASRRGRLRIALRLAPGNRFDQDSPEARARGPLHRATAKVRITRIRGVHRPRSHRAGERGAR